MYKVILWGGGTGYNQFCFLHGHEMVDVVAIVDKRSIYKKLDGVSVINPRDILIGRMVYDYLIITAIDDRICKEIVDEAVALGIDRNTIIPMRVFKIPFFDFDTYIKIKESNISIVSDYCFAGYLYHKFGMKFTSPTINMFADNYNYYRFLSDIRTNMNLPMEEVKNVVDDAYLGTYTYPRGKLGDVCEWHFNHDISYITAAERWRKGVERFNWDNYLAIMTIRSDEMAYKFDSLFIEHKIGFYWKDLGLKSVVFMPEWNDPKFRKNLAYNFAALVNGAASEENGVRSINWMRALLHDENFRRVE